MFDIDAILAQAKMMNAQLATLNAEEKSIATAMLAGGVGASSGAGAPFTINLPIAPNILTDMLLAANRSRLLGSVGAFTASLTIPAGTVLVPGTAKLSLPNPEGKTVLFISSVRGIASYYSTGIVLTLTADGQNVTGIYGSPNEFTVTGPFSFQATKYTYVQSNAILTGYNTTSQPTTVTFSLDNFTMDNGTFEDYWLNLINLSTDETKRVAALA